MWWHKYTHIPFVDKGRGIDGCDCWGLVRLIYQNELNIELPDYLDLYESTKDYYVISKLNELESQKFPSVPLSDLREFDVITLRVRNAPIHVAVALGNGYMIHCERDINTVCERINSMKWKSRIVGVNRYA